MDLNALVIALAATAGIAFAQTGAPQAKFEAASVRSWVPNGGVPKISGGPGTNDPGRVLWESVDLKTLLMKAYDVESDQVSGPSWMDGEKYTIAAVVPLATTQEQFRVMLQNLLAERFRLALHHEPKQLPVYELTVAKGGAKMDVAAEVAVAADPGPSSETPQERNRITRDATGCPVVPQGRPWLQVIHFGKPMIECHTFASISMPVFAKQLEWFVRLDSGAPEAHVIDKTGLDGQFAFKLKYLANGIQQPGFPGMSAASAASDPDGAAGPSLYTALEQQLGLKLLKTKDTLDRIVVDQADRVPAAN